MNIDVRRMAPHDAEAIAYLERAARTALHDQRGGRAHLAERPSVGDWTQLLTRSDRAVWVATIDDVVVAYLELGLHDSGIAEVMQVYVEPAARELGCGELMLAAAMQHARAAGCCVIEGSALPGDRETKNLYERAGIVARRIILSRPLDRDL